MLHLPTVYLSCIQPVMAKKPIQLPKRAETSVDLIVLMVASAKSTLILLPFLSLARHEPGTRNALIGP